MCLCVCCPCASNLPNPRALTHPPSLCRHSPSPHSTAIPSISLCHPLFPISPFSFCLCCPSFLFSSIHLILFHQIYHLSKINKRYLHERANNTYSVLAAFCADLTATAIGLLVYIPGRKAGGMETWRGMEVGGESDWWMRNAKRKGDVME